jgi:8-oxo-dGTP diphosphatase
MKRIEVVAAVIVDVNNKYMCVQRGFNNKSYLSEKWEFPGGKIEANENHEEALIREIQEELKMQIEPLNHIITVDHTYPDFQLIMHAYLSKIIDGEPVLTEHLELKWLSEDELSGLDWAAADIPIVYEIIGKNE